jgi:radical SAM superfamily enzyme YgiQ (UPF0313 family)
MTKNFRVLFLYPSEALSGVASSNLAILAACLKNDGFKDIKLFDCFMYKFSDCETQDQVREKLGQVKKTDLDRFVKLHEGNVYDDFVKTVDEFKPNLIAVTVVDATMALVFSFLKKVKDRNIPVVVGGTASTFLHEMLLASGLVDFACVGEGEGAIVDLCNKLYNGEDCSNIKNIYTVGKDGDIIRNPLRPLVNLNDLPLPDFSIYDEMRFYRPFMGGVVRTLQIDIDRGCPYGCTYCVAPKLAATFKENNCGSYYRLKSWDKVFEEMKELVKLYKLNFMWISSETILAIPTEKLREFGDRYIKEINLPLWCQSRLDTFTEEKTKILANMGCKNICVGLEHGSELIRKNLLNKHITNEKVLDAIRLLTKYGIYLTINNMIGLPGETREDVFEGVKLNKTISEILKGKHNINVFTFMPFSGTELRQTCIEKGYIEANTMSNTFFEISVLNMPTMTKEEIYGLEKTLLLYIMLPESYYPDIKIAEQDTEEGRAMFDKLLEIKNNLYK